MMKGYVLHGIDDLHFEEVVKPVPKNGEVLVKVMAAGICGSDIPRIFTTGAHNHPLIPGHEFSGQVVDAGSSADKKWIGKRVGVFPLIPCNSCPPCKKNLFEMCRNYNYLGSRCNGAFAEYVVVPVNNLIELPDCVTYEEAAMMEPMAVAVHAMRRINPDVDDAVAVCGLGTIGLLLVMFLREAGIKNILVIGNKDFQKENVLKLGIEESNFCDIRIENVHDWLMVKTAGNGVDAYFECVGKNETVLEAVNTTTMAGRICFVGNPYSDMELDKNTYWKILRHQLTVTGTWNSSFTHEEDDDWHYVLNKMADKKINPSELISHRFSLEELNQGFYIMKDKSEDYIKIMAVMQ